MSETTRKSRRKLSNDDIGSVSTQSTPITSDSKPTNEENILLANEDMESNYIFHVKKDNRKISKNHSSKYPSRPKKEAKSSTTVPPIKDLPTAPNNGFVECPICFKKLKSGSYKQHAKTHFHAKPFPCSICSARFTRRGDVIRHRLTLHENAEMFSCTVCNKKFFDRSSLILHSKKHRKHCFSCEDCGHTFMKKYYYDNHVKFVHPIPSVSQKFSSLKHVLVKDPSLPLVKEEIVESEDAYFDKEPLDDYCSEAINVKVDLADSGESPPQDKVISVHSTIIKKEIENENRNSSSQNSFITVSDGIASFSHRVDPMDCEFNKSELVNDVINMIVDTSRCVFENLQSSINSVDTTSKLSRKVSKKDSVTNSYGSGTNRIFNDNNEKAFQSDKSNPESMINPNFNNSFQKLSPSIGSLNNTDLRENRNLFINVVRNSKLSKDDFKKNC